MTKKPCNLNSIKKALENVTHIFNFYKAIYAALSNGGSINTEGEISFLKGIKDTFIYYFDRFCGYDCVLFSLQYMGATYLIVCRQMSEKMIEVINIGSTYSDFTIASDNNYNIKDTNTGKVIYAAYPYTNEINPGTLQSISMNQLTELLTNQCHILLDFLPPSLYYEILFSELSITPQILTKILVNEDLRSNLDLSDIEKYISRFYTNAKLSLELADIIMFLIHCYIKENDQFFLDELLFLLNDNIKIESLGARYYITLITALRNGENAIAESLINILSFLCILGQFNSSSDIYSLYETSISEGLILDNNLLLNGISYRFKKHDLFTIENVFPSLCSAIKMLSQEHESVSVYYDAKYNTLIIKQYCEDYSRYVSPHSSRYNDPYFHRLTENTSTEIEFKLLRFPDDYDRIIEICLASHTYISSRISYKLPGSASINMP